MKKILLISSSGGHFTQLKLISDHIKNQKNGYIIKIATEKISSENNIDADYVYKQFNRKKIKAFYSVIFNTIQTLKISIFDKPDVVISTGAGMSVPAIFIFKIFGSKIIYIESFAKRYSLTATGKFMYRFADIFYVQWPELHKRYPRSKYKGGLY